MQIYWFQGLSQIDGIQNRSIDHAVRFIVVVERIEAEARARLSVDWSNSTLCPCIKNEPVLDDR
jgi:hypothetical protein